MELSHREIAQSVLQKLEKLNSIEEYTELVTELMAGMEFKHSYKKSKYLEKLGYVILEEIYDGLDPTNIDEVTITGAKLRRLFKVNPSLKRNWNKSIERSLKNLVLKGKGNFNFRIDDYPSLQNIIESWQSLGLSVRPWVVGKIVLKEISGKDNPRDLNNELSRIANIFDNYASDPKLKQWIIRMRKPGLTNAEIKNRINKIDEMDRPPYKGKHLRNHLLARYVKILHNYTCDMCDANSDRKPIEASHNIPLHLGVKYGGVDRSWNLSVLCHSCHKFEEECFDKEFYTFDNDEERLDWIMKKKNGKPE